MSEIAGLPQDVRYAEPHAPVVPERLRRIAEMRKSWAFAVRMTPGFEEDIAPVFFSRAQEQLVQGDRDGAEETLHTSLNFFREVKSKTDQPVKICLELAERFR